MSELTANQAKAMKAWEDTCEDFDVLSFDTISRRSGLPRYLVRRTVRAMARKGFTRFCFGCWTDDGTPAGSGYGLTDKGRAYMDELARAFLARLNGPSSS